MSELKLAAQPRTLTGRKVGQLRTKGLVPVTVYGNIKEPVNLQVSARNLETVLHRGGFSQMMKVDVEGGGTHNVLVREIQRHPINNSFVHVDLYAVNLLEKQRTSVPIVSVGRPTVLIAGMVVLQEKDVADIEALPSDIPASIEVDVTGLNLDSPITIADLPQFSGVTYLGEATDIVFTLLEPRVEVVEEPAEEAAAEPEVVARGKAEDEAEEE